MPLAFRPRLLVATLAAALAAQAHAAPGFYRQPALSAQNLVFVSEGDLWQSALTGGKATRLTTHQGLETQPAISPDGQWLAFTGQYDGSMGTNAGDLYVMPMSGGLPKRLTWDGVSVKVWGYAASGEVLFTAPTANGRPGVSLYAVDPKTGTRRALPVDQASDGMISADGRWLYFTRDGVSQHRDNARHYRGGGMASVWVLDLQGTSEAKPLLAKSDFNDRRPMPYLTSAGKMRVAFISDRDGSGNLWSVDAQGGDLRQHTRFKDWDIRQASIAGRRVAFDLGADLHVLDLDDGSDRLVQPELGGDFDQSRERFVARPQEFLSDVAFSPDGKLVSLSSRGHLATQGVAEARRAELPMPADGRCRDSEFSSDSKSVFALCDFGGEVEIWRFAANGLSKPEALTHGATSLRTSLLPSPDGRWLAHTDQQGRLFLTDLKAAGGASTQEIDHLERRDTFKNIVWSADSRHLAYGRGTDVLERDTLMLYSVDERKLRPLTSSRYDSGAPAFSADGHWLYFVSAREFKLGNGSPWGDRNTGAEFRNRNRVYALALQAGERFPFTAPDELEKPVAKEEKKDEKAGDKKDAAKSALPAIDFNGLTERLYQLPLPAGNYRELKTDGKRLWWLEDADGKTALKTVAIDANGGQPDTVAAEVRRYGLSADGKKLMLQRGESEVLIVDAAPKLPTEFARSIVRWTNWQIATDPKAEWRQMFTDAWRMHRDTFFDPKMRGVDWRAVRSKYAPLVERVNERSELSEIFGMMSAEVGLLHSQIVTPELRRGDQAPAAASLGARFSKVAGKGWRIDHILQGDPELPEQLAPLARAGLDIREGDVITSINGRATGDVPDLAELLRGQADQQVLISVERGAAPARQLIVKPVSADRNRALVLTDWQRGRAAAVTKASNGRIGYLHLSAMVGANMADFAREFYAQLDKDALIVDVRFNNGGSIDSWLLDILSRRTWMRWQDRNPNEAAPYMTNMQQTFRGPVAVLINSDTYSDGETFSEGFKRLGLGPLIGRRTAGAGVWLSDNNRLLDKGMARAAELAQVTLTDGNQIIEGVGVTPDIDVDNPPRASFEGKDAQLERAVAELLKSVAAKPVQTPKAKLSRWP
ncbi:S41 family peptidase [Burkholderiaceae bacterium UC74_6]